MCDCSSSDGFYYATHRWTWDPGILFEMIWLLLEDKQFSRSGHCKSLGEVSGSDLKLQTD